MNHANYQCARCKAKGCKLWRESYVCRNEVELLCAVCVGKETGLDTSSLDADGKRPSDLGPTECVSGWVPAVPTEDGYTFWGYAAVPGAGCLWWRGLPSQPPKA